MDMLRLPSDARRVATAPSGTTDPGASVAVAYDEVRLKLTLWSLWDVSLMTGRFSAKFRVTLFWQPSDHALQAVEESCAASSKGGNKWTVRSREFGEKNGKKPCRNYFITQGFCPWPSTCKGHHVGLEGRFACDESERQTAEKPAKKARK